VGIFYVSSSSTLSRFGSSEVLGSGLRSRGVPATELSRRNHETLLEGKNVANKNLGLIVWRPELSGLQFVRGALLRFR
jgi:hypothetical protein